MISEFTNKEIFKIGKKKGKEPIKRGTCRVCGKPASSFAPTRYQLCEKCKMRGILID